jgi:hypothetical protein
MTTRRRQRQHAEIAAAATVRPAHALDLAFEHFEEYGPDPLIFEILFESVANERDPALTAEFDALIDRFNGRFKMTPKAGETTPAK